MAEEYDPDREDNYYRKCDLLRQMEGLASQSYSTYKEWIETKDEFRSILDDWKNTGPVNCREARRYHDNPGEYLSGEFKTALDGYHAEGERLKADRDNEFADRAASKEALLDEARGLVDLANPFEAQKQYRGLKEQWTAIGFCGEWNDALWDSFRAVGDEIRQKAGEKADGFAGAAAKKAKIIDDLSEALRSASPGARMPLVRKADSDWKEAGSAGRGESDLWRRYQAVVQPVKDAAREHASKIAERVSAKQSLIEEAKVLLQKAGNDRWRLYQEILSKWKAVGGAGRSEEGLWAEFKTVGDQLRAQR